jgi:DeoR/GlpR family transcriptional regulator of sugar metabolism
MKSRRIGILGLLSRSEEVPLSTLVMEFKASEATIRRDLAQLETEGKIIRTFGGARMARDMFLSAKSFQERTKKEVDEKKKISESAIALITPGMTIALDNGTTTWMIATLLRNISPLTVITNSLPIINAMSDLLGIDLISVGGRLRLRNLDFIGNITTEILRNWHTDIAFVSGDSIRPLQGIYKIEDESAAIVQAMCFSSNKIVAVMDHTKIDKPIGSYLALPATKLDLLITDRAGGALSAETFANTPYEVQLVE